MLSTKKYQYFHCNLLIHFVINSVELFNLTRKFSIDEKVNFNSGISCTLKRLTRAGYFHIVYLGCTI